MKMNRKAQKIIGLVRNLISNKDVSHNFINTNKSYPSDYEPPKEYELIIQKLESDVRNHIRVEQQLKLHIETVHNKMDEMEKKIKEVENEK